MADVPSNSTRIVPIMAGRRYTSKDARSAPKQQQPRASRAKSLEAETLKLPCLEELGLYALPTKGDGMSYLRPALLRKDESTGSTCRRSNCFRIACS